MEWKWVVIAGRDDPLEPSSATQSAAEGATDDATLRLLAEELSIAKETLDTGRVRISTHTRERQVLVDEDLAREQVEIETIPVGQRIDAVPEVRQEGDTTIVPVVEEVLVVERRLMLKEEIRIRRVRTTERHHETVALRYQEAVVARYKDDKVETDISSVPGSSQKKPEGGVRGR